MQGASCMKECTRLSAILYKQEKRENKKIKKEKIKNKKEKIKKLTN